MERLLAMDMIMTKLTFAIGDIHGRLDLLEKAIDRIESHVFYNDVEKYTVVFCGDYVDRGLQSAQVVDFLIRGPTLPKASWVCLKGNHEDIMMQCLDSKSLSWWVQNGGGATLLSYNPEFKVSEDVYPLSDHIKRHYDWMYSLPLYHMDEHRAFVHAGFNPHKPINLQIAEHLMWDRERADQDYSFDGKYVVHGHTVVLDGPVEFENKINLDVGAVFYGRMPIAVFDDSIPGGPVDMLEVKGPTLTELYTEQGYK